LTDAYYITYSLLVGFVNYRDYQILQGDLNKAVNLQEVIAIFVLSP